MLLQVLRFEWRYFTRQPSLYVTALLFFFVPFLLIAINKFGMGGANLLKNGSYTVVQIQAIFGFLAMFLVVNFVADTALRDHSSKMAELLYCKPINAIQYQVGRLLGAMVVVIFVTSLVPLGLFAGSLTPWVSPERIGPINLAFYITGYVYFLLPTVIAFSLLFYGLAVRFRSMMAVYLAAVALFIGYEITGDLASTPAARDWAALLDPFAISTFFNMTRYWTIFEQNTQVIELGGVLVQNRLLWLTIGSVVFLIFGGLKTRLNAVARVRKPRRAAASVAASASDDTAPGHYVVHQKGKRDTVLAQWLARCRFEVRQTIFSPSFIILCILLVFVLVSILTQPYRGGTTDLWPFTQYMVEAILAVLSFLIPIVITYYTAEIVWRDQQEGFGEILGAAPVSNVVLWSAKLIALCAIIVVLLTLCATAAVGYQAALGHYRFEAGLYAFSLFYFGALPWMMMAVLALLLQVISPNKYIGMFLFVLFIVSNMLLDALGFTSTLYRFARSPELIYSDMNGYGWALRAHTWYMLYWGALAVLFCVLSYGLWHRGPRRALAARVSGVIQRIGHTGKAVAAVAALLFLICFSTIFYNTRILNEYVDSDRTNAQMADYETRFAEYADAPFPVITRVDASVDIFPEDEKIVARAAIEVHNKSLSVIDRFLVQLPQLSPQSSVIIEGGTLAAEPALGNTYWFEFDEPMQPGERRRGSMSATREHRGFVDGNPDIVLVENGTSIMNKELFPVLGYFTDLQLVDAAARDKHGLPPARRAHKLEDKRFHQQSMFGNGFDFIDFEATVSTSNDQIAMAPGYLQKQWVKGERNYFHYKMDAPIVNFYAFTSARLEVMRDDYKGVSIELYYHPDHDVNLTNMRDAVKDSIDYFSANFGPYQHRQVRILEIPAYRNYAQSFANTIPFPEVGWVMDLRDPHQINRSYFVTAHEMAHQWWGHQVGAANVQGKNVISESLSEYSALMVVAKRYGTDKLRHYLRWELDGYLRGRPREILEELPLGRTEDQTYIHYQKGAMVMMSILDHVGEARLNSALRNFLEEFKYRSDPYPTTLDLVAHLKKDASEDERAHIASLFDQITLYDLKATEISAEETADGQYEVSFTINANRFRADGQGRETEEPLSELIDVGLFSADPDDLTVTDNVLYLQKHKVVSGDNVIKLVVPTLPEYAGIDPFIKLIDRDSMDNIIEF